MVRKVTLSVKIQAKVNFEGMGAKPLDMSIMEVKTLMGSRSRPDQSCSNINTLIAKHLSDVIIRIEELNALKSSLENMASKCDQNKTIRDCGILNYLHT